MRIMPYVFMSIGLFYLFIAWNFRNQALSSVLPCIAISIMCFFGTYVVFKKLKEKDDNNKK